MNSEKLSKFYWLEPAESANCESRLDTDEEPELVETILEERPSLEEYNQSKGKEK